MEHNPVLLKEAIDFLNLRGGKVVLDATADGGGHAMEICRRISEDGLFIGIDEDSELLKAAETKLRNADCKSILILGNFRNLDKLLEPLKINFLDAAFFDLGMSSLQLHNSGRGFSFKKDEPLIMTFKSLPEAGDLTAAEILNKFSGEEIQRILKDYGEERYAGRITKAIVRERKYRPFKTTFELMEVIGKSVPPEYRRGRISFATRTFQALRVAVNDELGALEEGLAKAWALLRPKGRLAVISFHSLEDRIVKNFFKEKSLAGEGFILTKKPVTPSGEEIFLNPRSRSAKLRSIEKNGNFYKN